MKQNFHIDFIVYFKDNTSKKYSGTSRNCYSELEAKIILVTKVEKDLKNISRIEITKCEPDTLSFLTGLFGMK